MAPVKRNSPRHSIVVSRLHGVELDMLAESGKVPFKQCTCSLAFDMSTVLSEMQEKPQLKTRIRDCKGDIARNGQEPGIVQARVLVHI